MKEKLVTFLTSAWKYILTGLAVLLASVFAYFAGSARRKGEVDLKMAERELDQVNQQHEAATKQVDALHTKQVRLVSDILAEQMRRAEEVKRTKGLTDEQVLDELRARGDILPADSDKS